MKEYQKILGNNNPLQNGLALTLLLEKGRENILNDNMAKMKSNDLYDFIKNEINIVKNKNRER